MDWPELWISLRTSAIFWSSSVYYELCIRETIYIHMKIIFGVDLYSRGLLEWVVGADNVNKESKGNTTCYNSNINL